MLLSGAVPSETPSSRDKGSQFPGGSHDFHRSNLVTGKGLRSQAAEQEVQTIHEENVARLQAMAPEEILKEQQQLLAQLGNDARSPCWDQASSSCYSECQALCRVCVYFRSWD